MKPENFEQVKKLMGEREYAEDKVELLKQSNCVTFSKNGRGSIEIEIENDTSKISQKFKDDVINSWTKTIEIIDEKLKDL